MCPVALLSARLPAPTCLQIDAQLAQLRRRAASLVKQGDTARAEVEAAREAADEAEEQVPLQLHYPLARPPACLPPCLPGRLPALAEP